MKDLIIIGAGGFALEVIDLIEAINTHKTTFNIIGLLDDDKTGTLVGEYKIIGTTKDILEYRDKDIFIAIANPVIRKKYYEILKDNNVSTPNLIHPNVEISKYSNIEKNSGVIINSGVTIGALAKISAGVIIDTKCYIGHEVVLNAFSTIYSGAMIAGNTHIGENSEIGMKSIIIQGLDVGSNTLIGAGSVCVKNIGDNVVAVGNPCRVIKGR